jgi:hypothetical protein
MVIPCRELDERIDAFDPGVPVDQEVIVELPPAGP